MNSQDRGGQVEGHDLFGLDKQSKIMKSGVRDIFTPHTPIVVTELFFGREDQVKVIINSLMTPGRHVVLYGERGVGKSSLANTVTARLLKHLIGQCFVCRCDTKSTFQSVFYYLLEQTGYIPTATESAHSRTEGGNAGLGIHIVNAGIKTETTRTTKTIFPTFELSPSDVARSLPKEGLYVIDEIDAMKSDDDRQYTAEVIKHLSDMGSSFKILAVGIAKSCADLLSGHPSVQRCICEVRLDAMSDKEIEMIVEGGAKKAGLIFNPEVSRRIVELSSGYPYFTHLLCLKCAEKVIGEDRRDIKMSDLEHSISIAVKDAEGTLLRQYNEAVRSNSTDMYITILNAAASIDKIEFTAGDLRTMTSKIARREISQNELNNYFRQRLVSNDGSRVLTRESMGVYRFTDPRMRSFVRLCSAADKNPA